MNSAAPISQFKSRLQKILSGKRPAFVAIEPTIPAPTIDEIAVAKQHLVKFSEHLDGLVTARIASDAAMAAERDLHQLDLAETLMSGGDLPNPADLASGASGSLILTRAYLAALNQMAPAAAAAVRLLRNHHARCLGDARSNVAAAIRFGLESHLPEEAIELIIADDPRAKAIVDEERQFNLILHFNVPSVLVDGKKFALPAWRTDPKPDKTKLAFDDVWHPTAVAVSIRAGLARVQVAEALLSASKAPAAEINFQTEA